MAKPDARHAPQSRRDSRATAPGASRCARPPGRIPPPTNGRAELKTNSAASSARSCAYATAAHSSFNTAIGCRHAIEVFKHVPILICIPLVRESAMQLLVTVRN